MIAIAALLVLETVFTGASSFTLPHDQVVRALAAAVCSGVAGGGLIIPIMIFVFGADIRTAGTAGYLAVWSPTHLLTIAQELPPMMRTVSTTAQIAGIRRSLSTDLYMHSSKDALKR